jgi:hypothetical protein
MAKEVKGRRELVSGAIYHNFEETPIFTGKFVGEHVNDEGKVIGYDFLDVDGQEWIITNAFSITKALDMEVEGTLVRDMDAYLEITFLGKTVKTDGKPFNRYSIVLLG